MADSAYRVTGRRLRGAAFNRMLGDEFEAAYGERPMFASLIVRADTAQVSADGYRPAAEENVPGVDRGDSRFVKQSRISELLRMLTRKVVSPPTGLSTLLR
jgi:hypothetical protein